jgi:hypothetical protein
MKYIILFILVLVTVASSVVDAFGQEEPDSTLFVAVAGPDLIFNVGEVVKAAVVKLDKLDAYFFSLDVMFDPLVLEYDTLIVAPDLPGAILVGNHIGDNRVAVAVTLTDTLALTGALSYFKIEFNVRPTPVDLSTTIRFENIYAADVNGTEMLFVDPNAVTLQIVGDPNYTDGGGGPGDGGDGDGGNGGVDPVVPDMNIGIVAHDLFRYGFEYSNNSPSRAIQANRAKIFDLFGGSYSYANNDYPLQALRSTNWYGAQNMSKYWNTEFSSIGFENLVLSWQQWGSNTGPRDFRVDYSFDGLNWNQFPNSAVAMTSPKSAGSFYNLNMDSVFNNKPGVHLRWVMDSQFAIAGGDSVSNSGTNLISNIAVQGWAFNDSLLVYRPGDTNNDGVIDHTDVLPLGVYWMSAGPKPKNKTLSWNLRAKQEWVPAGATYADTNGDGYVNHLDLQPIGMFYGRSYVVGRSLRDMILVHDFDLSASKTREIRYRVSLEDALVIKGVSGSLHLSGMDPADYDIRLEPMFDEIFSPEMEVERRATMLSWTMGLNDGRAFAWVERVPRNISKNQVTKDLFELVVEVRDGVSMLSGDLMISDVSIVDESGVVHKGQEVVLTNLTKFDEVDPMIPTEFRMLPAYPNPFNPSTSIRWAMPDEGHVTVRVLDMLGRDVGVIGDAMYGPGEHGLKFDAVGLSSGIYLVVVESLGNVGVQKVMLIK